MKIHLLSRPFALTVALAFLSLAGPLSAIETEDVTYEAGEITAEGYLALPKGEGPFPGVLVVHEWWGLNDYARKRADMLAELGYAALAVDMYGDGKTADHPEDAGAFAGEVREDMDEGRARFVAGMEFLQERETVDAEKIAAIGYCFGGSVVLQMAADGVDGLDGVASFHGSLGPVQVEDDADIEAKILVCHGGADPFVPEEDVKAFKEAMADADVRFVTYEGASHSFTSPAADELGEKFDMPIAYDPEADEASWKELTCFLEGVFAD